MYSVLFSAGRHYHLVVFRILGALLQLVGNMVRNDVVQEPVRLQVQVMRTKHKLEEIVQCKLKDFNEIQLKGNPTILQCKLSILTKIQIEGNPTM